MANQPNINRNALVAVKRATTGSLPIGRGGVFTGAYSADGFALVDAPSGADGIVHCVVVDSTPSDTDVGYVVVVGWSLVQLRIGSVGVTKDDKLNLLNATGVWRTAPLLSQNCYYLALQDAAANTLCWAIPIASRPL